MPLIKKFLLFLSQVFLFGFISILDLFFISPVSAQISIGNAFFATQNRAFAFKGSLGGIVSLLLPNAIMIAGLIFMYLIIYGGYMLIVYGGQNNTPGRVQQGKNAITYGVIGLLLVVSSYFILQIISTVTGINFINSPVL